MIRKFRMASRETGYCSGLTFLCLKVLVLGALRSAILHSSPVFCGFTHLADPGLGDPVPGDRAESRSPLPAFENLAYVRRVLQYSGRLVTEPENLLAPS